jgi:FG-GAP-like repeat
VKALRNTGNLNKDANKRNWDDLGTIAPGVSGVTGEMIRFADMNGDGLADFLMIAKDGSVRMSSNQGLVGADVTNLRFADLTGDGKADMIYVDAVGRAFAWVNGGLGSWQNAGRIATIRADEDLSDSRILFADVNGDGRADYLIVYGNGAVKAWLNNGNVGKQDGQLLWSGPYDIAPGVAENDDGSEVRFADLNGDGFADYLVLYDGGSVDAWLNQQQIPPNGRQIWRDKETVATGVGEPGSKIRLVQLNDDGKADYIVQYEGGAADAYLNTGDIPGSRDTVNWKDVGEVAAGVAEQGPVFYADIDGDGKDDYLVRYADGSISAWLNTCDWKVKPGGIFPEDPGDDPDPGDGPDLPDPGNDDGDGGGTGPGAWRNVSCNYGSIDDLLEPRDKRWSDAQADEAMTEAFRFYNDAPPPKDSGVEFSMVLAAFFQSGSGLSTSMTCNELVGATGCSAAGAPNCNDGESPAGWLILTSMLSINSVSSYPILI